MFPMTLPGLLLFDLHQVAWMFLSGALKACMILQLYLRLESGLLTGFVWFCRFLVKALYL